MKIGIDIDGVVTDTIRLCAQEFTNHFGYEITCEDIAHQFSKIEGGVDFLYQNEKWLLLCSLEPLEGAVDAINALHENHEVYFISARDTVAYDSTVEWFQKYNMLPRKIILTGGLKSKGDICKELGIDVFIEDSAVNASEIVQAGVLVLLYKAEYNIGLKDSRVIYCENWNEIFKAISKFNPNV